MRIITEDDIEKSISMELIIQSVETAFSDYHQNQIIIGDRSTLDIHPGGNTSLFLPAVHQKEPYFMFKQASSFPANRNTFYPTVQSRINLYSAEHGGLEAIIDANRLTTMKTGAAAAVATKHLANNDASTLLIIGAGELSKNVLEAIIQIRPISKVLISDLNRKSCEQLIRWAIETLTLRCDYEIVTSLPNAVEQSDVICTCTTSSRPVLHGKHLQTGCHINAMGSFTPAMQEIDTECILKSDLLVTDCCAETWQNAGDLLVPFCDHIIDKTVISGELGAIVNRTLAGRNRTNQISLYESIGFAALDLACAITVYEEISS